VSGIAYRPSHYSFGFPSLNGKRARHAWKAKTLVAFLRSDRTDRVSNEPMFGVAIKKTGCAILIGRRSRLATGTCTNRAERLINGWATIQSPWKKNVAARANSILRDARRWLKINPSPYPIV